MLHLVEEKPWNSAHLINFSVSAKSIQPETSYSKLQVHVPPISQQPNREQKEIKPLVNADHEAATRNFCLINTKYQQKTTNPCSVVLKPSKITLKRASPHTLSTEHRPLLRLHNPENASSE